MKSTLVRIVNQRGVGMIHRRECYAARRTGSTAVDFPQGDDRTDAQLAIDAAKLGFRPCRQCRPFPMPDPALMPGYERPGPLPSTWPVAAGSVSGA